jgi:hypothetical protein
MPDNNKIRRPDIDGKLQFIGSSAGFQPASTESAGRDACAPKPRGWENTLTGLTSAAGPAMESPRNCLAGEKKERRIGLLPLFVTDWSVTSIP